VVHNVCLLVEIKKEADEESASFLGCYVELSDDCYIIISGCCTLHTPWLSFCTPDGPFLRTAEKRTD
jgi:hypothetical protein